MLTKRGPMQPTMLCCTIEDLMPKKHFLRDLLNAIDFDFIYDRVAHLYSALGRPSIDPVIIIKMLLIGYLYGIESERRLESEVQLNIAYRWFLGLNFEDSVPDHSTFSQLRRRKFNDSRLFEDIFDEVVRKCIATGLVDGSLLLTDSTHVRANAANDKQEIITLTQEPSAYMKKLDELAVKDGLIEEVSAAPEVKTVERKQSLTDPDCGMMKRPGKPYGFHYLSHNTVDGNSGIITDVFVTAGNVTDSTVYTERIKYQVNKFGFHTKEAGGDAGYDTREIQADMLDMGIQTYMPIRDARNQFTTFTVREFEYDAENDEYICPNNCRLRYYLYKRGSGIKCYISDAKQC